MNDPNQQEQSQIGDMLATLRKKKRFSKQALAEASTVSATYIGLIESGFDPNSGRPVTPSAKIIRALARALADGDGEEESHVYEQMMTAVGYMESSTGVEVLADQAPHRLEEQASPYSHDVVTLRDPRLRSHCRAVLENWEDLSANDQAAVLSFLKLVYDKNRLQIGKP
ncbi:MAG: helix-turn-helix transcriptional regulator [Dehalococcoidia bacterium]|nr:helix-turn-helix transcriptional regulator [Dehalococcoidia bacterium]